MDVTLRHIEAASTEELLSAMAKILELRGIPAALGRLSKAVKHEHGEFTEWFLRRLEREAAKGFENAQELMWRVIRRFVATKTGRFNAADYVELRQLVFDLGSAISLDLVGVPVPTATLQRLEALGFTPLERVLFPVVAYRLGYLKQWIEQNGALFEQDSERGWRLLKEAALKPPLTRREKAAVEWAKQRAAEYLKPVFTKLGDAQTEAELEAERQWLQRKIPDAMGRREGALKLARELYKERKEIAFRDWERVARTEIANSYAHGAFQADVDSGVFAPETLVYRVPRKNACKTCLALFTNPDGSFRLYRVRDLVAETTPEIDVGVRKERRVRATIGVPHPNDLCSPWLKFEPAEKRLWRPDKYRQAREEVNLEAAA